MARRIAVVIADDLPTLRKAMRRGLERDERFDVVGEAGDGKEALILAGRTQPDVVVIDLAMPNMNGIEAIPKIKAAAPGAKIIAISGFLDMGQSAIAAGADGFFEKTAPPAEIALTILGLIEADS